MSHPTVLVTGATGQQGGAVVDHLLKKGYSVRGLSRNTDSPKAQSLTSKGVDMVAGHFSDHDSLVAAVRGVDVVFFMTTPFEEGTEVETRQGLAMIAAIQDAGGVQHVIYNSVASANQATGIPHFESKYEVEKVLSSSGLNYTIVAPVYFMDNLFMAGTIKEATALALGVPEGTTLQQIAVSEIGSFVSAVVDRGAATYGQRYDIASDEQTGATYAYQLSEALGRAIPFISLGPDAFTQWGEDMVLMVTWFGEVGYSVDIDRLKADFPEVEWLGFSRWTRQLVAG